MSINLDYALRDRGGGLAATPLVDPLLALVNFSFAGEDFYNAASPDDDAGSTALFDAVTAPGLDRLKQNPPAPVSLAGVIAGLNWAARETAIDADSATVRPVLCACLDYLRENHAPERGEKGVGISDTAGGGGPEDMDAELLALGREFDVAWRHMKAADARCIGAKTIGPEYQRADALSLECQRAAERLARLPAVTFEGLRVKARAILGLRSPDWEFFEAESTDMRLMNSILADLLPEVPGPNMGE